MVAKNIRCLVIEVPVVSDAAPSPRPRAKELLPWADPYIAGLIRKLQSEVRSERAEQRRRNRLAQPVAASEAKPPGDWPLLRGLSEEAPI